MFMQTQNKKWLKSNFSLEEGLLNTLSSEYKQTINNIRKIEKEVNPRKLNYIYQTLDSKIISKYDFTPFSIDKILNIKLDLINRIDEKKLLDIDKLYYACGKRYGLCQIIISNYISSLEINSNNKYDMSQIDRTISLFTKNYDFFNKLINMIFTKAEANNDKGTSITTRVVNFIFSNIFEDTITSKIDINKKVDFICDIINNSMVFSKLNSLSLEENKHDIIKYLLADINLVHGKLRLLLDDNIEVTACLLNNLNFMPDFLLKEIMDTYSNKDTKAFLNLITKGNISAVLKVAKETSEVHRDYLKKTLKDINFYRNYSMKVMTLNGLKHLDNKLEYEYKANFLLKERIGTKDGFISFIPNKDYLMPTLNFLKCNDEILCEKMDILEMISNQLDDKTVTLDMYKELLGYLDYGNSNKTVEEQIKILDSRSSYFENHSIKEFFNKININNNRIQQIKQEEQGKVKIKV